MRKPASILIVEDDAAAREMYREALIGAGYRAVGVPDGLDALKQIETNRPSAVILDLLLPRVAGIDVYRELRTKRETRTLPVVIVTGSDARDWSQTNAGSSFASPWPPMSWSQQSNVLCSDLADNLTLLSPDPATPFTIEVPAL